MSQEPNNAQPFDILKELYETQLKDQTQQRGYDFDNMSLKERADYVKLFVLMVEDELHEMLHELPYFKPWKRYDNVDVREQMSKVYGEFADVIHFFLNVMIGIDMTPEMLYEVYKEKHWINGERLKDTSQYKPDTEAD